MKFLIGKKEKMGQIFTKDGVVHPATFVSVLPLKAVEIKTNDKHGYSAVKFGFGVKKSTKVNKPQRQSGETSFLGFREYRLKNEKSEIKIGDDIKAEIFKEGDEVSVSGISKGRGFQGVVKRHGFHGGRRTHGQKHSEREPGAIGGGARAGGRVAKGMRMAGRMGGDRVTVSNLSILKILPESNEIIISGALPGRRGTLLEISEK